MSCQPTGEKPRGSAQNAKPRHAMEGKAYDWETGSACFVLSRYSGEVVGTDPKISRFAGQGQPPAAT